MALNFPSPATDGLTWTDPTGRQWVYEALNNSWTAKGGASGGMVYKGGIDVTTPPPAGAQSGWLYVVTTGGTVNAGFTGLTGVIPAGSQVVFGGPNWQVLSQPSAWARTGTEIAPTHAGDSVFTSGDVKIGGTSAAPNAKVEANGDITGQAINVTGDAHTTHSNIRDIKGANPSRYGFNLLAEEAGKRGALNLLSAAAAVTTLTALSIRKGGETKFRIALDGSTQWGTGDDAGSVTTARAAISPDTGNASFLGDVKIGGTTAAPINGIGWVPNITLSASGKIGIGRAPTQALDVYAASGSLQGRVEVATLPDTKDCGFSARSGNYASNIFIYKHSGITHPWGAISMTGAAAKSHFVWFDAADQLRVSPTNTHIGTTSGTVVGTQTSDQRLKDGIKPMPYGLAEVKQLDTVSFTYKNDPDATPHVGFLAQQVLPIVPESVFDTKETLEGGPEGQTKLGMDYTSLVPVLVNAIKELSAKNDALEARLAALEPAAPQKQADPGVK